MAKLRLLFAKEGRAVYLSHLDLLRTVQRVFLRAGVALRHSQGFHPHPLLSFALPLPLGQSSVCELLDFETEGEFEAESLPGRLNERMPEGLRAISCYAPVRAIRELAFLSCEVEFLYDHGVPAGGGERIRTLLTGEKLVIEKRTKHKELAEIDIRPLLRSLTVEEECGVLRLGCTVAAQNPGLNPALLARAVERYRPEDRPDFVRVRRVELLDGAGEVFR